MHYFNSVNYIIKSKLLKKNRKIYKIPQGFWVGPKSPSDGAEGYSLPHELKKARKPDTFLVFIYLVCIFSYFLISSSFILLFKNLFTLLFLG